MMISLINTPRNSEVFCSNLKDDNFILRDRDIASKC